MPDNRQRMKRPQVARDLDPKEPIHPDAREIAGRVCSVQRFLFTWGLMVGVTSLGHALRYCYEHEEDARAALATWDGREHPPGPWIKCKGTGVEMLNPELSV